MKPRPERAETPRPAVHARAIFVYYGRTQKSSSGQHIESWTLADFSATQWLDDAVVATYRDLFGEENVRVVDLLPPPSA